MPVNVQHALMFTFVFILIVSLLTATTYIIVSNMLADTYRYEKAIEKANEKLRLVAVATSEGLYYGVRNIATMSTYIRVLGIVDIYGNKHVLRAGFELKPGDAYIGGTGSRYSGVIYAVTGRGNVFSAPIMRLDELTRNLNVRLRGLAPACIQVPSPISYGDEHSYSVGMCTYAYVFGYLVVNDPYSDDTIQLVFGPYNIAGIYKDEDWDPFPFTKHGSDRRDGVEASATFRVEIDGSGSYRITMPFTARRTDWNKGLTIHGCIGILWRSISNTMYSVEVTTPLRTVSRREGHEYIGAFIVPSAVDAKTLITYLAQTRPDQLPIKAPSGTQYYVVFARCFTVESGTTRSISTWGDPPRADLRTFTVYSYLVFPGRNSYNGGTLRIDSIDLVLGVDPRVLIISVLNQV